MTTKPTVAVPPPKPRTSPLQFAPSLIEDTLPENLLDKAATRAADLNFKVTEDFHRAFKHVAFHQGQSMKGLLDEMFAAHVERHQLQGIVREAQAGVVQLRERGRDEQNEKRKATDRAGAKRRREARRQAAADPIERI